MAYVTRGRVLPAPTYLAWTSSMTVVDDDSDGLLLWLWTPILKRTEITYL